VGSLIRVRVYQYLKSFKLSRAFFYGLNPADSLRHSSRYIQDNRKLFTESRKPASTPYLNFEFSWVNKLELLGQLLKTNI